jgi:Flp pilus assembly pilin Flp
VPGIGIGEIDCYNGGVNHFCRKEENPMLVPVKNRGQGMVEYALILVLVVIVAMIGIGLLGGLVVNLYQTVNTHI